jgi:hypothetical protein
MKDKGGRMKRAFAALPLFRFALLERMSILSRASASVFIVVFLTLCCMPGAGICAEPDSKLVTRIETATAVLKNGKLTVRLDAMAPTSPTLLPKGGKLMRRGDKANKDGLMEYDCYYKPGGYSGTKLRLIKASLTEHVPPETKGARIFAELNHVDAVPEPPKKKKKLKEGEPLSTPTTTPSPTPSATP